MRRRDFLTQAGTTLAAGLVFSCSQPSAAPGAVIQTDTGFVRGQIADGVHRFLGVPFAEAPFGQNRFRAPVQRAAWDGVFEASQYGQICPQTGGLGVGDLVEGEDCLNLNIWTPDPAAKGLPVMVWAHGGGQVSGTGSQAIYDGTHFAKEGVVLVTNNRRLGAEGYLYLEEDFGAGFGPGNLGILDQLEVLRWVQRNVERFGGDPNNVTLFGESGGAAATQAVIATQGSKGLLHRAIPQSGGMSAQRPASASIIARNVLERLNIKPGDHDALLATPWAQFIPLHDQLAQSEHGQPQVYLPVIGEAMPLHPVDAASHGVGAEIDYLIGTCRDEMNFFAALPFVGVLSGFERRRDHLFDTAGVSLDAVRAAYAADRPEQDAEAIDLAILGDAWFRLPSLRVAEEHSARGRARTYMYQFTWESQLLGAAHALDLVVFGNGLPLPGIGGFADYDQVATKMRNAWVNFARTGDPSTGDFTWPQYDRAHRRTALLDDNFTLVQDPFRGPRAVLGDLLSADWQSRGL